MQTFRICPLVTSTSVLVSPHLGHLCTVIYSILFTPIKGIKKSTFCQNIKNELAKLTTVYINNVLRVG